MKFSGLLCFLFLTLSTMSGAEPVKGWENHGFLSEKRLATLRKRVELKVEPTYSAYLKLQDEAAKALERKAEVPVEWYVPGYYVDPKGHGKAKDGLAGDANGAYALALMYKISGEEKYALAAAGLINAWPRGVQKMNVKDDSKLSFSYHFPAMIFAAALIEDYRGWPADEQKRFKDFVRNKALPMNTMERENNWGNWGMVLVMASAVYLQDQILFDQGVERWKQFLENQVAEDGHLPKEVTRNNNIGEHGIWYSHFSLMPQTIAAEVARLQGVDLFEYRSPNGRSLRLAFDCLAPWAKDPKTFPFYKGPDPADQKGTDYISYWEILNAHWANPRASAMLKNLRPLNASHSTPFLTFSHGDLLRDDQ